MPEKIPMTAVVLAGGKSSRMGRDKALLSLDDRTMLESLVHLLGPLFEEMILVVNERERYQHLKLDKIPAFVDFFKGMGPLAGLYTALSYSTHRTCFVFTCDMPFVDQELIRQLAGYWKEGDDAVCVQDEEEQLQPFPAVYSRSVRHLARLLLERGEKSMRRFLDVITVKTLVLEKNRMQVLTNMNTIEDYYHVLKIKKERVSE